MAARAVLLAIFTGSGVLHFLKPRAYEAIMPPYLPAHRELVYVSGAAELLGAAALVHPQARPIARWWLAALLVAVFPANVHMAVNPDEIRGLEIPRWLLWVRLPLQGGLLAMVWHATRD